MKRQFEIMFLEIRVRAGDAEVCPTRPSEYICRHIGPNMENKSNTWLLITSIALAWLPTSILLLRHDKWAVPAAGLVALTWLIVAIGYYRSVRRKAALWIFALLPVVFGPVVFALLIIIGVLLSRGNW